MQSWGLPTDNVLVQPVEGPYVLGVIDEGKSVLVIAKRGRYQLIGIDCVTGEIVALKPVPIVTKTSHINADLAKFLVSIGEFNDRYPFNPPNAPRWELDHAARILKAKLEEIDHTAFNDEDGFWITIIYDVSIGDFGAPR